MTINIVCAHATLFGTIYHPYASYHTEHAPLFVLTLSLSRSLIILMPHCSFFIQHNVWDQLCFYRIIHIIKQAHTNERRRRMKQKTLNHQSLHVAMRVFFALGSFISRFYCDATKFCFTPSRSISAFYSLGFSKMHKYSDARIYKQCFVWRFLFVSSLGSCC